MMIGLKRRKIEIGTQQTNHEPTNKNKNKEEYECGNKLEVLEQGNGSETPRNEATTFDYKSEVL